MNLDALRDQLADTFPLRSDCCTFDLVSNLEARDDNAGLFITLRLINWEPNGSGGRQIMDIREQQCLLIPHAHLQHPHLSAYLAGWTAALTEVITRRDEAPTPYMPCDFVAPDVLRLKRPRTMDDYIDAMLSSRKRLGAFMP